VNSLHNVLVNAEHDFLFFFPFIVATCFTAAVEETDRERSTVKSIIPLLVGCRSGIGSYYGTLSGPIPALSPQVKPPKDYKAPGKNFYTNPGKKGTGYGYVVVVSH